AASCRGGSQRRTGSPSIAKATSMSANCRGAHGRASRKTRCRRSAASSTACARSLRSSKDLASKPPPGPSPQARGIGSCRVGQMGGLGECPSAVLGGCLRFFIIQVPSQLGGNAATGTEKRDLVFEL